MGNDHPVKVEGLWKRYGLPLRPAVHRIARRLGGLIHRDRNEFKSDAEPWALRNVSFEAKPGETLGIIGRNGAGKSTLLKVLAGVTPPSRGKVEIRGQIFSMIELNAGVHPELTGRENAYLLGAIMGLSRRQVNNLLPDIEDFVELEEWFDQPVRTYSSGMLARLGFGVATSIKSDILLIDETFSVGDLKFQNKGLARIRQMREHGAAILLVTHSLDMLQLVAQRGIVLDEGRIVAEGSVSEVLRVYEQLVFHSEQRDFQHRVRRRISTKEFTLRSARIFGSDEASLTEVEADAPFGVEIEFHAHRLLEEAVFSVGILNAAGVVCVWNVSQEDGLISEGLQGSFRLRVWYSENKLVKGTYEVNFSLREKASYETFERLTGIATFTVTCSRRARGILRVPVQWQLARSHHPKLEECHVDASTIKECTH